ncbi:hypothetical protein [Curtobacterium sp. UCD-KPL2560]|uniref:hypothetical protein n=1 Tax=Curtobacterium sp. UCD-KPL2560 TaxID=1885315 RepID=UPI001C0D7226|nr:hypothetical protein [Curtobacterium sp. UCD-KPL2560]
MLSTLDAAVNRELARIETERAYVSHREPEPVLTTPAAVAIGYAAVVGYAAQGAAFTAGATAVVGAYAVGKAVG